MRLAQSIIDEATNQEWCRVDGEPNWHFASPNEVGSHFKLRLV